MFTIYRWEGGGLKEVPELTGTCWINLADPSTEEISRVQELARVPREFLTDPLDKDERPRLEIDEGVTLLIVHVPYHEPHENLIPFHTLPLGIVLTDSHVITICNRQTPVTSTFLDQIRRVCPPEDQFRFAFQILWHSAILYLRYLRDVRQRADMVEQDLHESISNEALMRLLNIEKSLVYFTTSLKANDILIGRLEHTRQLDIPDKDLDILEDVAVEYRQALEMATIHSNILTGTLDTFASIISNNLNNVMKYLTSITLVLMLPTLVASIYGMNIELPLQHSPYAFIMLMGFSIVISIAVALVMVRRRFF
ncbi:MAG: magnesium transporter CorA family protein [Kiritimatiellia bacterium]|jgi:magnesium transporter|nr:magnesium transporter CorA family protein [Kiritimatiellia bacterium]NLC81563.1 magnesium transporter CorA family protein [Lentisphaerota bacterium]OQC33509.1 MAG: Magnesium transport protein CorA [Verrucomicrobia bacterium ADurb.Bin070]MDD4173616.1 magnesium transporter CorA family protein [Kiritimatiellia bacterium]MDD4440309.1 magnesium transporter CorA family protein [Kiritimatiellia bacterium]